MELLANAIHQLWGLLNIVALPLLLGLWLLAALILVKRRLAPKKLSIASTTKHQNIIPIVTTEQQKNVLQIWFNLTFDQYLRASARPTLLLLLVSSLVLVTLDIKWAHQTSFISTTSSVILFYLLIRYSLKPNKPIVASGCRGCA